MPKTQSLADERLRDIELLLLWEGAAGNARLRELFAVRIGQASLLLKHYRERFPRSCVWDTKLRLYVAVQRHLRAKLSGGTLDEYLALLSRSRTPESSVLHSLRQDLTEVSPAVFAVLHRAASTKTGIRLTYRSMTNPEPHARTLFPHSIVCAGRRWHVRGYVVETADFRDFALGRIVGAEALADVSPVQAKADKAWAMRLKLRVVPHPRLSESQRQVVSAEYMNGNPHVDLETRAATVHYLLQDARIAIDAERERPPEYQLCVEKPEEITAWLFGNETGKAAAGRTGRNRLR
mgnify:CR=1 FL=1